MEELIKLLEEMGAMEVLFFDGGDDQSESLSFTYGGKRAFIRGEPWNVRNSAGLDVEVTPCQ